MFASPALLAWQIIAGLLAGLWFHMSSELPTDSCFIKAVGRKNPKADQSYPCLVSLLSLCSGVSVLSQSKEGVFKTLPNILCLWNADKDA